jgi:hypothetical protein
MVFMLGITPWPIAAALLSILLSVYAPFRADRGRGSLPVVVKSSEGKNFLSRMG